MNQIDLHGKNAIVTGAARNIGLAIAERLLASGARCSLWDHDPVALEAAAQKLNAPERIHRAVVDVSDEARDAAAAQSAHACYGAIDLLVNNAAIQGATKPLWECTPAEWRVVLDVDLFGVFLCCRAVVPLMLPRNAGRIVSIASIAGKEGKPNASHYSAAKAGVIGLTKALGRELSHTGIRVTCVAPGVIETDVFQKLPPDYIQAMLANSPLGRFGRADEVAAMVAWLCSDESAFSTGSVFDLSGGRASY